MIKSELEVKLLSNKEFSCQIIRGLWVQNPAHQMLHGNGVKAMTGSILNQSWFIQEEKKEKYR